MSVALVLVPQVALGSPWVPPMRIGRPTSQAIKMDLICAKDRLVTSFCGCTAQGSELPHGWYINRSDRVIGRGRAAYERAAIALQHLDFFEHVWLTCQLSGDAQLLAVCSRQLGFLWLTNVNYVLQRVTDQCRSSITWGTTQHHVLAGEETISVSYDTDSNLVRFSILSFSRPRHLFSIVAYPYVLAQQRRFVHDATTVMERIASGG